MKYSGLFFVIILFSGCSELVEDCIFPSKPEFETHSLKTGTLNKEYNTSILGRVKNESSGSYYTFYFTLLNDLPDGLKHYTEGRELVIYGTPKTTGKFNIKVQLEIDESCDEEWDDEYAEFDCDNVCFAGKIIEKTYTLNISGEAR
ncbi:hypothetical protein [Reichenbachiella versicolor]|uniref:hypothetical protein n=1 Tax=Reichenbachiella versicolor TaxID=1821036 RepID=UPI000D6E9C9D|nr:hypothetical protein [Reichenbachiella versicolor]